MKFAIMLAIFYLVAHYLDKRLRLTIIWTVTNLTYLVTSKQCIKQCTNETTDQFRNRWNNYKPNAIKFDSLSLVCRNTYINASEWWLQGLSKWVLITCINKTEKKDRKKIERYYRMQTLKTKEPYGLNIADSMQSAHTLLCLSDDYYFGPLLLSLFSWLSINNIFAIF